VKIREVWAVYFSATGTTKKIVERVMGAAAADIGGSPRSYDFSLPVARSQFPLFFEDTLVVFGMPVYAGRVPNVLLKQLDSIQGGGALAAAVVLFGNRGFDDALIELRDLLRNHGFAVCAAGAFVGEHAFSTVLGKGRPDEADMAKADFFAKAIVQRIRAAQSSADLASFAVEGTPYPYRPYYQPRDREGNPVDIRKVKPLTNEKCNDCKVCARVCTMGSINMNNVHEIPGVCIKCCACVKRCPRGAKYFTGEQFLYHRHELEKRYTRRAEPALFLPKADG
jgi:ferredoxin